MKKYHECCGFPEPKEGSVFYEDSECYACLAFAPKAEGHTVVVLKMHANDLEDMPLGTYIWMMTKVLNIHTILKSVYKAPRVYVDFWNEAGHVHFHLIPRHEEGGKMGSELLMQPAGELTDLSKVPLLIEAMKAK